MTFGYKRVGRFDSDADATRWAKDNGINLSDLQTNASGQDGAVDAYVRDDDSPSNDFRDRPGGRHTGFF